MGSMGDTPQAGILFGFPLPPPQGSLGKPCQPFWLLARDASQRVPSPFLPTALAGPPCCSQPCFPLSRLLGKHVWGLAHLLVSQREARQGDLQAASCSALQSQLELVEAYLGEEEAAPSRFWFAACNKPLFLLWGFTAR